MKKITLILGISALLVACGEDQQPKVCECIKLYSEISAKADKADAEGGNSFEVRKEAQKASNGKFEECEKFQAEMGDDKFATMSENCK
jgi:hypothetical protein